MTRLRILYVCPCWLHDKAHGGQLRALQMARALQRIGDLTVVIVGAHKVDESVQESTRSEFGALYEFQVHDSPVRGYRNRIESVFGRNFTNIHGVQVSTEDEALLQTLQQQHDLVWFFKLRTANYFRNACWERSAVDIDDLPSTMEQSRLSQLGFSRTKLRVWLRLWELTRHEQMLHRRFSVLSVCSEADRKTLSDARPVYVIPNGFQRPSVEPQSNPAGHARIGFIGLFNYAPNSEGVRWFYKHCWNKIKSEVPEARLRLIGQSTDGPLCPQDESVDGLGWVADPRAEIATWSAAIVPIHFGAGTRVKIADAFSRKCPVVSTRFGALGYEVVDVKEILLADTPEDFSAACIKLLKEPAVASAMAENAYTSFLTKWTWDAIAPKIWETAQETLRRSFGSAESIARCQTRPEERSTLTSDIAVVIPTYNRKNLVQRAIRSVLEQTVKAAQIIVVDDGSTDGTAEACQVFGGQIEYIRQANAGVSAARNEGIRRARFPWIAFLDSDDHWTPTHLEKVSEAICATRGEAIYYFTDLKLPNTSGAASLWTKLGFVFKDPYLLRRDATDWMLSQHQPCAIQCSVFSANTLKQAGGFDTNLRVLEDTELFSRLGIQAPVCAVNTIGCIQTADDEKNNRLTGIVHEHSYGFWAHERTVWAMLLKRFPQLKDTQRRSLRYSLAVAHWRLARISWRSRQFFSGGGHILKAAKAQPGFLLWLLRHGKADGWQESIFPPCRAE